MVPFSTAYTKLIDSFDIPLKFEVIPLTQATNRVTHQTITAPCDSPAFITAAMDGYALDGDDQEKVRLPICGIVPAGTFPTLPLEKGKCVKTFTGSMMTQGANTLIPIENVTVEDDHITITKSVPTGFAVRQIGEDYTKGSPLVPRSTPLTFAHIGLLASWGKAMIPVVKKPIVSILATGSELLDLGETPTNPTQIRSVNNMMLSSLALQAGADVLHMGITSDDEDSIRQAFNNALSQSDIVVSTGGVSVGDFDFVKEIITKWPDSQLLIKGVTIKPGQHITVAKVGEKYFFGLPGFSASAAVTFSLFVAPLIRLYLGLSPQEPLLATFKGSYTKKHTKKEFLPANLHLCEGSFIASLEGKHQTTSANITALLDPSTALIMIDEETTHLCDGDKVVVYPFPKGLL